MIMLDLRLTVKESPSNLFWPAPYHDSKYQKKGPTCALHTFVERLI